MSTKTEMRAAPLSPRAVSNTTFRRDIEGLRAIAVLAVLVYHLDPVWLPGGFAGVDMFFVISGFLITSHLASEVTRTGRVDLLGFYARRIRRLIPASFVVLVATLAGVVLLVPRFEWRQFGIDIAAAGAYVANWVFGGRSVDYLAEDSAESPVQHFWSLSVEEQFYLVWPLAVLLVVLVARRAKLSFRRAALVGAGTILVSSLAFAAVLVSRSDVSVYFSTAARVWELAIGAMCALIVTRVAREWGRWLRNIVVVIGLVGIAFSVAFLNGTGWPAFPALLPTLSVGAILVAGGSNARYRAECVLEFRPLVWLGGLSYGIYLWHASIIVLARYKWPELSWWMLIGLGFASILMAWLSLHAVENPMRYWRWLAAKSARGIALGALCLALTVSAGLALAAAGPQNTLAPPADAVPLGAAALPERAVPSRDASDWTSGVTWAMPSPHEALRDVPAIYSRNCQQSASDDDPVKCEFGDLESARVIALVGDSKAAQWTSAIDRFGLEHGYKVVTFTKSSCPLADAPVLLNGKDYPSCERWNERVMSELTDLRPQFVVTSQVRGTATSSDGKQTQGAMSTALVRTWERLVDSGSRVIVILDTPQPGTNIYECVAENSDELQKCTYDKQAAIKASALPSQLAAAAEFAAPVWTPATGSANAIPAPVAAVDFTDVVCPSPASCPPIVGNVLIYRSGSHITDTYVLSMYPHIARSLEDAGVPSKVSVER